MQRVLSALLLTLFLASQGLVLAHHHGELGHQHLGYCSTPDEVCHIGDVLSPAPLAGMVSTPVVPPRTLQPLEPTEPALPTQSRLVLDALARGPPC